MKKLLILSALTLGLAAAAPVTLTVNLTNGKDPFTGKVTTSGGQTISMDTWKFYVSNVALVKADGSEQPVSGLNLVKLKAGDSFQNVVMFKGNAPAGEYKGVRFSIGVPRAVNHKDATTAKAPLSVDDGMFWAWNSGYIFSSFEGKTDLNGSALPVALHYGEDKNYSTISFADLQKNTMNMTLMNHGMTIPLNLDVAKLVSTGPNGEKFDLTQAKYQQAHFGAVSDQLRANLLSAFSMAGLPTMNH